jgi:hypothetical protein
MRSRVRGSHAAGHATPLPLAQDRDPGDAERDPPFSQNDLDATRGWLVVIRAGVEMLRTRIAQVVEFLRSPAVRVGARDRRAGFGPGARDATGPLLDVVQACATG